MKVLVVEDDSDIASLLTRNFRSEGHAADRAASGEEALDLVRANSYSAIVLDVMLPGKSGIEICKLLRKQALSTTIIMLSARDAVADRIEGLSAGADDYLVKPFAFEELLARLIAQQRRRAEAGADEDDSLITRGRLTFNQRTRDVTFAGKQTALTEREADLLMFLMRNADKPLTREAIFEALWQAQGGVAMNVVDVYVGYLRRKLHSLAPEAKGAVRTLRGVGYMFQAP